MPTLKVTFRGMCLFVYRGAQAPLEVYLLQPQMHPHHAVSRKKISGNKWEKRSDINSDMDLGPANLGCPTLPGGLDDVKLNSLIGLPNQLPTPVPRTSLLGKRYTLHGGAISVDSEAEFYVVYADGSLDLKHLTGAVSWTGEVSQAEAGELQVWNGPEDEIPTPNDEGEAPSVKPLTHKEIRQRVLMHFPTYFEALGITDDTPIILVKGTPKRGIVPLTLYTSSCPQAFADA